MVDKTFANPLDTRAAQRALDYINAQGHGAGSWPDNSVVQVPRTRTQLYITDRIGPEQGGWERYVEARVDDGRRVLVTFVYDLATSRLVRTF